MFDLNVSSGDIAKMERELQAEAEQIVRTTAAALAAQTYGKAVELASEKLHSSKDTYMENLELKQVDENTWVVTLHPEAMWIEEGMDRHEMIDNLLFGKNGRQPYLSKDGLSQYKVIPIKLNKAPTRSTQAAKQLQQVLKKEFADRKIPYGKIENGPDGKPLEGRLHKLDIMDRPLKTADGVGQGHGPIGQVKQGMGGIPFLKGVNVLQKQLRGPTGALRGQKDIMTFRIVSTKQKGSGRWVHPGVQAAKIIDKTFDWASNEWERTIKPQMVEELEALNTQS
jgi:hypothetical protein